VLVGVGGQGILFTTKVLAETALRLGHEVIGSETHGMSQRGGSVISHLKIGEFPSPLVRRGTADFLIALDESEAYKSLDFLRDGGACFVNTPDSAFPPDALRAYVAQRNLQCAPIGADGIALELSAPPVANTALLGFAASHESFPFSLDEITETINLIGRERMREINTEALRRGVEVAKTREGA
jgi:indolepyruvate ferredoxin oxidoreductase beta subunit